MKIKNVLRSQETPCAGMSGSAGRTVHHLNLSPPERTEGSRLNKNAYSTIDLSAQEGV